MKKSNVSTHLQEFRLETMGKQDTPQMRLMNRLEKPWFDFYVMCDQLAMAAALDKKAMAETKEHYVSLFGDMLNS